MMLSNILQKSYLSNVTQKDKCWRVVKTFAYKLQFFMTT